ncbi:SAM-dependent methyltransferase [Kitasatospora purpeofusca]|uniref:class I SAM-dependent methyltransferase n=1 Tax=Kitasatospora purpeofusca TaxID=67352 RepID=UPI002A5AA6CD|nr:SAM-dependent methyltransferase [Kitasatospora purpeofusca]MDY0812845.1 SAM-dependent methyltransferase [Kitasatospora purpeofusca]
MASAGVIGTTAGPVGTGQDNARARDWAEIQERMLVPLYEAVHDRLEVGPATSVLGLGCRSGLALLLAAGRGAQVAGLEQDGELRALAGGRGLRVGAGRLPTADVARSAYSLVTVFEQPPPAGEPRRTVAAAARLVLPGGHVVLAAWGPRERCGSAAVLDVARRMARRSARDPFELSPPGALEDLLVGTGLRPAGGGRVGCPFAYPDLDSAVRGLLSTGLYDAAAEFSGASLVTKELEEALQPYLRPDGTVRMANVFRYLIAERPR